MLKRQPPRFLLEVLFQGFLAKETGNFVKIHTRRQQGPDGGTGRTTGDGPDPDAFALQGADGAHIGEGARAAGAEDEVNGFHLGKYSVISDRYHLQRVYLHLSAFP